MGFIKTTGKDGKTYYFKYELENQPCRGVAKVCFKTTFLNQADNNWFDFKVAPFDGINLVNGKYMMVTDMFDTIDPVTHQPVFKGKGLPEALIIEAQRVYPDKIIVSDSGGSLWEPGRAVWNRLVEKGLAHYDTAKDVYMLNR